MNPDILKMHCMCDLHKLVLKNVDEKEWYKAYMTIQELEKSIGNMKDMIKVELDKEENEMSEKEQVKYLKCTKCGYEDSSILVMFPNDGTLECPNCNQQSKFEELLSDIGCGMNFKEYSELVKFVIDNHGWRNSFGKASSKRIKYIQNSFDTRTNEIYSIRLDDKNFTIVNQNRHRNLKDWIYEYLNS